MKNKLIIMTAAVATFIGFSATLQAIPISGNVTFFGNATLDSGSSVVGATKVTGWSSTVVTASSGNLFATPFLTAATFTAPWTFGTGQTALWSFVGANGDTFTFNLLSSTLATIVPGSPSTLTVTGAGTISATGPVALDSTAGTWAFSTQDPSVNGTFSFSAASGTVPDGGTTVMLLGGALVGLGLLRKRVLA
jgi:hypothetical protein